MQRRITVEKQGSASTVVWNPWIEKARAMSDFGDEEWRNMVCIETANAADDAVSVEPGAIHTMIADVSVAETD
jgi:glucose-6-phosphate 1-epimerase